VRAHVGHRKPAVARAPRPHSRRHERGVITAPSAPVAVGGRPRRAIRSSHPQKSCVQKSGISKYCIGAK
jgi:hypothetical protein